MNTVSFAEFEDQAQEAKMLRLAIQRDLKAKVPGNKIAILYRNRNLKAEIERELIEWNIPYKLIGDTSFYGRKEVRDAIAMIRFIFKRSDLLAAYRVFKSSRIPFTEEAVKRFMVSNKKSMNKFLENKSNETKAPKKGKATVELRDDAKKARNLINLTKEINDAVYEIDDPASIKELLAKFWDKFLKEKCENEAKKKSKSESNEVFEQSLANVQIILDKVEQGLEREMEIEDIVNDLVFRVDHEDEKQDDTEETVQLMTIHASKGLEFQNVYIIGLDNVTSPGPEAEIETIEEERRIVYVALTRAEDKLAVSYARNRMHHGKHLQVQGSPFLEEIEEITHQKRYISENPAKQKESTLD
jgi:DNA helicase-2/ATP-dependent DNA helicase PcrA